MDLSLEEIISKNRTSKRGRGSKAQNFLRRTSGGRIQKRKSTDLPKRQLPEKWQHDLFAGGAAVVIKGNTKLLISNLDFGVNDADIRELFQEFGVVKRAAVHYDRSGRSLGTAEVIYTNRADASKAMERYNGLPLDGRPMNIQILGGPGSSQKQAGSARGRLGQRPGGVAAARGSGGRPQQRGRGAARGRGGRAGGKTQRTPVSKDQLDAELAAYTAQTA